MPVLPFRSTLVAQLHCLSEDGAVVITAQRWEDVQSTVAEPIAWLRLVRNGVVREDLSFVGAGEIAEMEAVWARLADRYKATGLTEDQMWDRLRKLRGIEQQACIGANCPGGLLPPGGTWCPTCGRSPGRVASGSLSGVRRYGVLVWDLRNPPAER